MVQLNVSGNYVTVVINGSTQEEVNKNTDSIEYNQYSDGKVSLKIGRRSFEMVPPTDFEIAGVAVTDADDFISKLNSAFGRAKVYRALLSQSGTNAPVATVLENTIGNIVWTRNGAGDYRGTLSNAFNASKVFFVSNVGESVDLFLTSGVVSVNEVYINSYSTGYFDGLLANVSLEIRVYP